MYQDRYCIKRGAVFLSYYVFTAGIMHVITRKHLLLDGIMYRQRMR